MSEHSDAESTSAAEFAHYYRSLGLQSVPARMPSEGADWKRPALWTWKGAVLMADCYAAGEMLPPDEARIRKPGRPRKVAAIMISGGNR